MDLNDLHTRLRSGEEWRPVCWKQSDVLRDGCCYIKDHTYYEDTPKTVSCSTSPAFVGLKTAYERWGSEWERVE